MEVIQHISSWPQAFVAVGIAFAIALGVWALMWGISKS